MFIKKLNKSQSCEHNALCIEGLFILFHTLGNWKQITHPPYLPFCPSSTLLLRLHSQLCALHNKIEYKQKSVVNWVAYLFPVALLFLFLFYSIPALAIETDKTPELEVVNLQLKWRHQFQFAGYYAAKQQGFYAEEGLDVHIHEVNQNKAIVQQVVSGEMEYAISDVGILSSYAKGQPIKALAAIFQHNPLVYISKASSDIVSPYEFRGKRIMRESLSVQDAPLRALLADANISEQQFTSVKHSYTIEDFIADKVDVVSVYMSNEPYILRERGVAINIIKPQSYGADLYGDILFTSEQEISEHPGRARRFARASLKGWKYAFEHTEEIIQLVKQKYKSPASIEHLRFEAREIRKLVLPDQIPLGEIKISRLKDLANIYRQLQLSRELTDDELAQFIYPIADGINLTEQELAWLKQHKVIRLGIDRNFAPYEWIDEQGNYQGISADYIRLLEQKLGVKFEIIKDQKSWADVLSLAEQGKLDMMSCLVKTAEREEFLNFSRPYLTSTSVIISESSHGYIESLNNLAGKKVAIQKGHYTQELLAKNFPEIKIISTASIKEALRMVSEGQVTAYVGDVTAASYIMKKEGFLNLTFSGVTDFKSEFRFATQKNIPLLASIINKALASIDEQQRESIYDHWRSFKVTQGIAVQVVYKYALLVFIMLMFFAYLMFRLYRSNIKYRVSEAKLKLILDKNPESVTVLDTQGGLLQINPTGLKMIDAKDNDQVVGEKVERLVIAKHRLAFNKMISQVLSGESCHLVYKIRGFSGKTRWVESGAVPLLDKAKNTVSILIVTRDRSKQKKAEETQKLVDLIYNNTSEGMMVLDNNNAIVATNPAFTKITGYSFDDVKGKQPRILKSGIQDKGFYQEMWEAINQNGRWQGELWNQHKKGDLYAERLVVNTIYDNDGKVEYRVALVSDITEKKEAEKIIWNQANYDSLTGLANRNMLMDRLEQGIKLSQRTGKPLAVIFLDLDYFKQVNDTLGHEVGDELLCEAAKRLSLCVRQSDTVARFGGDEFVVILAELEAIKIIDRVAKEIIDSLRQVFVLAGEKVYISASLGIAVYPEDSSDSNELIKYADQAMYISKEAGRCKFRYFTKIMQEEARLRMQLLKDLRVAVEEKQFQLFYQPIVNLANGKIKMVEALIRWDHSERGMVSLNDFIPLAEESRLIVAIDDWVYKVALQQIKRWRSLYHEDFLISVNKSAIQFRLNKDLDDYLSKLQQMDLPIDAVVIEITENLLLETSSRVENQLLRYRELGVPLSWDDFGSGYASLSHLKKFKIDYLKIDPLFVSNLLINSEDLALSEAIIAMAHKLGIKVIAEGIETEEQRNLLAFSGCDYGQGYVFSKAIPGDEFEQLLIENKIYS